MGYTVYYDIRILLLKMLLQKNKIVMPDAGLCISAKENLKERKREILSVCLFQTFKYRYLSLQIALECTMTLVSHFVLGGCQCLIVSNNYFHN